MKSKAPLSQGELFSQRRPPLLRTYNLLEGEIVVDNFAGGGGTSTGAERAIGRPVDIAINHDPEAIAMHRANHPETRHYCESIFEVDPREACRAKPVGLAWFSPDCTHHSRAKGAKPRDSKLRGLAHVVIDWARAVRPRIIMVENVEEFREWGPLDAEGYPIKERAGEDFERWLGELVACGYRAEYRSLVAADYGAPTTRRRFFLIARSDGKPIVWPESTHGQGRALPWRAAADVIDWAIPCPSIFERRRPLKEATLRRIALGIQRYVLGAAQPFIIPVTHPRDSRVYDITQPMRTITAAHRGEFAVVDPVCATNDKHLVCPIVTKHYGAPDRREGGGAVIGHEVTRPLGTVTARDHHSLSAAFLTKFYGTSTGSSLRAPVPTITGQGQHLAAVRALLGEALHESRSHVVVDGEPYQIVDIGMRMLHPRELFGAQGFPRDYVIDPLFDGRSLTQEAQIRLCGNAVPPDVAHALVLANAS